MNHVSKWPNPFMAALFFAGIFYDLLVFYAAIWPAMTSSGVFDIFVVAVTITLCYQYFSLILKDPGRASPSSRFSDDNLSISKSGEEDLTNSTESLLKSSLPSEFFLSDYCANCRVCGDASAHVRHCRLCDACMEGFDHHCLFLLTCVAKRNRRLFLSFLTFVDVFCIPTMMWNVFHYLTSANSSSFSSSYVSNESPGLRLVFEVLSLSISDCDFAALVFLSLCNWMAWLWIAYLIFSQIHYISKSHTTSCSGVKACSDDLNKKLSWKQYSSNLFYFLAKGDMRRTRNVSLA